MVDTNLPGLGHKFPDTSRESAGSPLRLMYWVSLGSRSPEDTGAVGEDT